MLGFFRNFSLSQPSFWLGFITGILFLWLLQNIIPFLRPTWLALLNRFGKARESLSAGVEARFLDDTLNYAQTQHIAAPLFALSEISIEPFLLAPPPQFDLDEQTPMLTAASFTIPYLPDWPELGSNLNAPTLTLADVLQGGKSSASRFVIIGQPGSGKTFALAHLASIMAQRRPEAGKLDNLLPVMVHVTDLDFNVNDESDLLPGIINALSVFVSSFTLPRLSRLLEPALTAGRALFMLDGMDELTYPDVDRVVKYLDRLIKLYPSLRMVVASSTEYFDGLTSLGFIPLPMGTWNEYHRQQFVDNWNYLWNRHIASKIPEVGEEIEKELIRGWLQDDNAALTPLEFTLKTWSAFSGDALGASPSDAVEAYIRRITINKPNARDILEEAALTMLLTSQPTFERKQTSHPHAIEYIEDSGILLPRTHSSYGFINPVINAYLAAFAMDKANESDNLFALPPCPQKTTTSNFLAALGDVSSLAEVYLDNNQDPLQQDLLRIARWLRHTTTNVPWKSSVLRKLVDLLQREKYSLGLRGRAVVALSTSGVDGVKSLFKQLLSSPDENRRILGVFGIALIRDKKSIANLEALATDPSPIVRSSSVLALYSIRNDRALEGIASTLLHGDENVRRTAAEAFANLPKRGHPTLDEGSQNDDLMVRRAVVFGLIQVKKLWAKELIEKMAIEDGQWVIRNAATHALEMINDLDPYVPRVLPEDSESPWLISYAGEQGVGIIPGQPATDLIMHALRNGTDEQRTAALERLCHDMDPKMIVAIYEILYGKTGALRETAFNTLWHMEAAGIELPSPTKFGLG